MAGKNLKNYDLYLLRLYTFAQAMGIKVISDQDVSGQGVWIPSRNMIKVDQNMSESEEIATFLHELGHALDDLSFNNPKEEARLHKAYYAVYSNTEKKSQRNLVVECEKRAWKNGRAIAKRLRIRLGKWYDEEEADCLIDYKRKR